MNIAKNMEVIFVAALAIISTTTFATAGAGAEQRTNAAPEVVKVGAAPTMTTITVSAKRLTAAEKAQLAD
jgi:hypothetical protein